MLDFLLPEGLLFRSVSRSGDEYAILSGKECLGMPMAVLVNDATYSAAEFFAAALREYDWATIVGSHTPGKGYSQATFVLSDGSAMALSTKTYYTPKGEYLEGVGLEPDVVLDLNEDDYISLYYGVLPAEEDPQLQKAVEAVLQPEK